MREGVNHCDRAPPCHDQKMATLGPLEMREQTSVGSKRTQICASAAASPRAEPTCAEESAPLDREGYNH